MPGQNGNAFGPVDQITGNHVTVILARLADAGLVDAGAQWYVEARKWAVSVKLIQGYAEDNTVRSASGANRAELAKPLNVLRTDILE